MLLQKTTDKSSDGFPIYRCVERPHSPCGTLFVVKPLEVKMGFGRPGGH